MTLKRVVRAGIAATLTAVLAAGCSPARDDGTASGWRTVSGAPTDFNRSASERYHRLATYPVYFNAPDPGQETAAEIATVTADGNTVIYTDAAAKRIGFVDLRDPAHPVGLGKLSLVELGDSDDQPTSVAAAGEYVLVVVDTTGGDFSRPSGRLDVVRLGDRVRVRGIDLGGQPDSIAVSPDGAFAAIAIENQRAEDGDLPQPPTGFVQLLALDGAPEQWTPRRVEFDVEQARAAGLDTPEDLEPEYVAINDRGQVAVTLQENNGVAVIDGRSGEVSRIFSAGNAAVAGIDTADDGVVDQTGAIPAVPREPDAIGWIGERYLATANEGDWKGGTRGWSIFDAETGEIVWDAGNSFERLAVRTGLHLDKRADAKGPEPEGLAVTAVDGRSIVLVAAERSNFVAVYDVSDPTAPVFRQILPTTVGPEGILPIPDRNLLVISSEEDDAEAQVRGSLSVYGYGSAYVAQDVLPFPSIVSGDVEGAPIGWGALGALAADPTDPHRLYTATDKAYGPARVLRVDVAQSPALIDGELVVTENGQPITLDVEGLAARPDGGFVLAVEGEDGPDNQLVWVAAEGAIERRLPLPADVADRIGGQGLEGVALDGDGVWVALQRELADDPAGVARLGRYTPAQDRWEWYGYPLERTAVAGDWIGISEIAVSDGALLVLERDKLNGPDARVKRIYRVVFPDRPGASSGEGELPVLPKTPARDLLPDLRATNGYVQEKIEGLAVAGNGRLYLVTDNDGVDDANGETQFFDLGPVGEALAG